MKHKLEELRSDIDWQTISLSELGQLYRNWYWNKDTSTNCHSISSRTNWVSLNTGLPDPYFCGKDNRNRTNGHSPFIRKGHTDSCSICQQILITDYPQLAKDLGLSSKRSSKGSVGVEAVEGRLRLRLPRQLFNGKQKYLTLEMDDTFQNLDIAWQKAKEIEKEILDGSFDLSLERYKPWFRKDNLIPIKPNSQALPTVNINNKLGYLSPISLQELEDCNFSGIYIITADINNEETPIYVGKSLNISQRWKGKAHHRNAEIDFLVNLGIKVEVKILPLPSNDHILLEVERSLITELQPKLNGTKITNFIGEHG